MELVWLGADALGGGLRRWDEIQVLGNLWAIGMEHEQLRRLLRAGQLVGQVREVDLPIGD